MFASRFVVLVSLAGLAACHDAPPAASATSSAGGGGGASTTAPATTGSGAAAPVAATDVALTTSDGVALTGHLTAGGPAGPGTPGVVLVHQFQRDDEQWGDLPEVLAQAGYRTLAFNLRGHGDSDPYGGGPLTGLLTDPNGAPRDVDAALAYLGGDGQADASRLAVVGTSIGANLAVASAIANKAKTYVALSPRRPPTESLAGASATGMASVLYLAGELDGGGQAADCQTMHDATSAPRGLHVYPGTADHGIALLDGQADARQRILDWLAANL